MSADRRMATKLTTFFVTLCSAVMLPALALAKPGPDQGSPNVLIILTDDQRASVDAYQLMPRTMKLFRDEGIWFKNAVATTPLCCPSRASILTGQYAHNHQVRTQFPNQLNHRQTLPFELQQAGYVTGIVGKYLNNYHGAPPYFDEWATCCPDIEELEGLRGGYYDTAFNINGDVRTIGTYSTRFVAQTAVDFLEGWEQRDDQPWLLYVAPYAPHGPSAAEAKYENIGVPPWTETPATLEKDRSDKPIPVRELSFFSYRSLIPLPLWRGVASTGRALLVVGLAAFIIAAPAHDRLSTWVILFAVAGLTVSAVAGDAIGTSAQSVTLRVVPAVAMLSLTPKVRHVLKPGGWLAKGGLAVAVLAAAGLIAMPVVSFVGESAFKSNVLASREDELRTLPSVDDLIGTLLDKVEALDESNTLAFYLSDNGTMWYDHGLSSKTYPYDGSVRIPLFMRFPAHIESGITSGTIVGNIDIAPTVYDAADITPHYQPDGRSMLNSSRKSILLEYFAQGYGLPSWAALWRPSSLYVEYVDGSAEYYGDNDPWQLRNVLSQSDPEQSVLEGTEELSRQLAKDRRCVGEACP